MIRALGAALVAFGAPLGRLAGGGGAGEAECGRREAVIDGLELLERELWERGPPCRSCWRTCPAAPGSRPARCFPGAPGPAGSWTGPLGDSWRRLTAELAGAEPGGPGCAAPLGEVLGRYEADGQRAALKRAEGGPGAGAGTGGEGAGPHGPGLSDAEPGGRRVSCDFAPVRGYDYERGEGKWT